MNIAKIAPLVATGLALGLLLTLGGKAERGNKPAPPLWKLYNETFKKAKYVDLTHTVAPDSPVWKGFGPQKFAPATDPQSGRAYTYKQDGFEATRYQFSTDQLGTQLDPPAHWNPDYPSIDELPATFTLRPLVVISIVEQVKKSPGYSLTVADIRAWERDNGTIPEGSVVMVRCDWSKRWGEPGLAAQEVFPGVSLEALQYLHLQRKILFHGHEPLDTDSTPEMAGEAWLLKNGYTQAEGVTNLHQVPQVGALVAIGYPKLQGGTGGYARFIAICPPDWPFGLSCGSVPEAPLARQARPLVWDAQRGVRLRK